MSVQYDAGFSHVLGAVDGKKSILQIDTGEHVTRIDVKPDSTLSRMVAIKVSHLLKKNIYLLT